MDEKTITKKSKWTVVDATLTITMPDKTNSLFASSRDFDLARIMPDYEAQDENIRFVFQYGVKQNLSDEIAGQKDASNETKLDLMESRFEELVRGEIRTKREKADMLKTTDIVARMVAEGFTPEQIARITAKK